jgi:hypothetical protein
MPLFTTSNITRPDRLTSSKGEKYHADMAKWCLNGINDPLYRKFIAKTLINWSFFKGNDGQWIFDEDLESFFLDESGDVRNRLKMTKNMIYPIVSQYVGNAVRLSYSARAQSISDFVINRREEELARLKFFQNVSEGFPSMKDPIKDRFVIGETEAETEEIFENMWTETHEKDINNLLRYIEDQVNIDEIKVQLAFQKAISGLAVYKGKEHNLEYEGEALDSMFFLWDMSSRKPDFSDAEYMGDWYYSDNASLFERYQKLKKHQREALERHVSNNVSNNNSIHRLVNNYYSPIGSKVPVYEMYWRDIEEQEYGWVEDKWKYPQFVRINSDDNDYTDADLIEPPERETKSPIKAGEKKTKIFVDVLRYCILTPSEEIEYDGDDIVYEYGIVPYQERYLYSPSNIKFPYKAYALFYDKGEVMSPIDNVISPQRFINRLISVAESHVNNSRGAGTIIDKMAVDPQEGEDGVVRAMNRSKPVFVDTSRTGSVQNSVGQYGATIDNATLSMFDIVSNLQEGIQQTTGVNESMQGTQGDKLVGVVEAQIQRGSLLQEPFYWGLTAVLEQAYQHMATVGKKIYMDNPRRLAIAVGDLGMQRIIITEDMVLDDFRIKIDRSEDDATLKERGNNLLFTLIQGGLITEDNFKLLYNRATPDDVADALREEVKVKRLVEMEQARIQPQQEAAQAQAMEQMMQREDAKEEQAYQREASEKEKDRDARLAEKILAEGSKNEREELKYKNK